MRVCSHRARMEVRAQLQELPLCFHRGVVGTELKSPGLVALDFAKPNRPESFLEGLLSSVVSVEHRPAERTGLGCFNVL